MLKASIVSLAEMPYNDKTCGPPPDFEMQSRAKEFRIDGWAFVDPTSSDAIKAAIAEGDPVVFGMNVAPSLQKHHGGGVYSRDPNEETEGGHAQVLIGYDNKRQAYPVQNSWGGAWGD